MNKNNINNNSSGNINKFNKSSSSSSGTTTNNTTNNTSNNISKEKKRKIWTFFGGNKLSLNDKQKSATIAREKVVNSVTLQHKKDEDSNLKHRWSTGVPRLQPLQTTISKENLVSCC